VKRRALRTRGVFHKLEPPPLGCALTMRNLYPIEGTDTVVTPSDYALFGLLRRSHPCSALRADYMQTGLGRFGGMVVVCREAGISRGLQQFAYSPDVIRDPRCHRWGRPQGLVTATEVIPAVPEHHDSAMVGSGLICVAGSWGKGIAFQVLKFLTH
jgi:hypothetical protein